MNRTNRKYFLSIFLISLFAFFNCNFPVENLQEDELSTQVETANNSTSVRIYLNFNSSRQIMPSNYTATEYKLKGTFNSKETIWTYDSLSKLQSATLYLNYGDWTFILEAYANDILIASDTITKTISDTTNNLTFEYKVSKLNYSEGSGNISVSISFPTDKKIASVTAALYSLENLVTPIYNTSNTYTSFTTDSTTGNYIITYTRNAVSSGSYYLIFKFYQTGVENDIGMWRDLVCVANGCTSSGESTVTEFNELYSINYHLNGITFKSSYVAPATFNKSQSIILPTADNMDQTNLSFTGWYETSDFSGDRITSWTYDSKTTDVNLYARNTATITFDMQNYGNQVVSQSVVYGTKASEPVKPTNDLMFFKGWFSDSEKSKKYNFNSIVTANKIVYAKWVDLETYWTWSYPTSAPTLTWEGRGTQAEPYIIMDSQELADLAYMVNNFTSYSGTYFVLGEDIELNYGKTVTGIDDTLNNWIPIGNATYNFAGNFDGNGKKIKGLYINDDTLENVGLFGIGNAPNNLTIESGYVFANASYVGGVIGYSKTGMEKCVNKATLNNQKADSFLGGIAGFGSSFKNCENNGILTGVSVGGIAGRGNSFENCTNSGEITATGIYCGGIGATCSSNIGLKIERCSNMANISTQGNYLGGIFGYFEKYSCGVNINSAKNNGNLNGSKYIGGIISFINSFGGNSFSRILNCIMNGDIKSQNALYVGGICGYAHSSSIYTNIRIANCGTYGRIEINSSLNNYIGGIVGFINSSYGVENCFSKMNIVAFNKTNVGGIVSICDKIVNCFYVVSNGVSCACPTASTKTSLGAVTSANGYVFSTDNTTLLYTGTLCEVLNSYRTEHDSGNLYKEWIVGEDGWPTFAE